MSNRKWMNEMRNTHTHTNSLSYSQVDEFNERIRNLIKISQTPRNQHLLFWFGKIVFFCLQQRDQFIVANWTSTRNYKLIKRTICASVCVLGEQIDMVFARPALSMNVWVHRYIDKKKITNGFNAQWLILILVCGRHSRRSAHTVHSFWRTHTLTHTEIKYITCPIRQLYEQLLALSHTHTTHSVKIIPSSMPLSFSMWVYYV